MKMKERDYGVDLLRIFAAFLVVLIHLSAENWGSYAYNSTEWFVCHFFDSIGRSAVPLFVMISGMFLLDPAKELTLSMLWHEYCKRIAMIFVVWSAFYAGVFYVLWPILQGYPAGWGTAWQMTWKGHYHLWYCKMLLGLYLLMPFLKKITAEKALMEYFLILCAVFTVIIPVLPFQVVKGFMSDTFFYFTLGFTGYFVLGYYLKTIMLSGKTRGLIYLAGIMGLLFTIFGSVAKAYAVGLPYGYYDPQLPNVVSMTIAIFVFFQYHAGKVANRYSKVVSALSGCTLGIYLIHPMVMVVLQKVGIGVGMCPLYISIPLVTVLTFIISLCLAWCMKKLPFIKNMV
jgi:surface polysaccharide O-acyltransferase-like enzyme